MRSLCALLVSLFIFLLPLGANAQQNFAVDELVSHEIITQTLGVVRGEKHWFAIRQKIAKDWHTYWLNAGDAGGATSLQWSANEDVLISDVYWPTPKIIPYLGLLSHAYEDEAMLLVEVELPKNFNSNRLKLELDLDYLVCKEICIPGSDSVQITLPVVQEFRHSAHAEEISQAIQTKPEPAPFSLRLDDQILEISSAGMIQDRIAKLHFIPIETDVLDHNVEQKLSWNEGVARLELTPQKQGGSIGPRLGGLLIVEEKIGAGEEQSVTQGFTIALGGSDFANGSDPKPLNASKNSSGLEFNEFMIAIGFAFLGGLILNLMPCVFPILSLKGLALAQNSGQSAASRHKNALAYFIGVLVSFAVLAGIFIALRQTGAALGWGFQFQSPIFVSSLAILFFCIALNLNGIFEFGGAWQSMGNELADKQNASGSFFTGALATIAATPCTAPFMGAALGYALSQSNLIALVIIMSLGLGFAVPMTLVSSSGRIAQLLPRPGLWMAKVKHALALPLYASVLWLTWVLLQQAGTSGVAILLSALIGVGLCLLLLGAVSNKVIKRAALLIGLLISVGAAWSISQQAPIIQSSVDQKTAWSPKKVDDLLAKGRNVLVDFTAAWCITCKVNEAAVLNTSAFAALMELSETDLLVADWTNQDERITKVLQQFGRAGVPLYLLYKPGFEEPIILPQLLTHGIIEQAIN